MTKVLAESDAKILPRFIERMLPKVGVPFDSDEYLFVRSVPAATPSELGMVPSVPLGMKGEQGQQERRIILDMQVDR
jgi:hypothetical protein